MKITLIDYEQDSSSSPSNTNKPKPTKSLSIMTNAPLTMTAPSTSTCGIKSESFVTCANSPTRIQYLMTLSIDCFLPHVHGPEI